MRFIKIMLPLEQLDVGCQNLYIFPMVSLYACANKNLTYSSD